MKSIKALTTVITFTLAILACNTKKEDSSTNQESQVVSSTIPGWHGYNSDTIGKAWSFDNNVISFDTTRGKGGDIVTDKEYEDFELSLEWKISKCGNSGIFWNIVETPELPFPWLTGPEMQVIDNECHPDAVHKTHRAADLYDMIETSEMVVNPAGEWNKVKLKSKDSHVEFWLNGVEVVAFDMHNEEWNDRIKNSKFKDMSTFGKSKKGRIGLQDHGDKVWYRNISIVEI